jgi:hypothetical protein
MLTVGVAAEQGGGMVEAEALIELFGVQHRAPVPQRFQLDAGRQGERGGGAGTRALVRDSVSFLQVEPRFEVKGSASSVGKQARAVRL